MPFPRDLARVKDWPLMISLYKRTVGRVDKLYRAISLHHCCSIGYFEARVESVTWLFQSPEYNDYYTRLSYLHPFYYSHGSGHSNGSGSKDTGDCSILKKRRAVGGLYLFAIVLCYVVLH